MRARYRYFGAPIAAASLLLTLGVAAPASADDYPSWDDVLAARENEAQTQAAIDEIEGLLVGLENEAAELGRTAQIKAEEYNAARVALDTATARADRLDAQADAASERAEQSSQRAGQLIAQLARTGGGSLTLELFLSPNADDLLGALGTASKVTEQAREIYEQATLDRNLAQSLTAQARVAEVERQEVAADAQKALDAAKAASDAAAARVAEQQAASDQMYAQLATLRGTTADVEARYMEGVTQEQEEQNAPPPPSGGPAPNPPPPAPNASAAAGAIAFAYAQLGDPYVFAGSGPDAWDCSGLTQAAYASVGVYIGAHLVSSQYYTMANQGRLVPIGQMVAGDLIFYADGGGFYHVTLYVGGGMMIEAPRPGVPVRVTPVRYSDIMPYAGRPTP
ncbi:C40 family peptidase [Salinibacterium soli]|uniref:NlpC/P60 family protein n=1 Tax=Antiquaquibacter soli TaxID=3064523 RepID=A0ABT9BTG2_9MICO|nr:C40 family peptidase [Protaetiibacter sp. WY-16]MDO7882642.1 NlpC/P60 family protein [Protaetiibacter sp. WY-16]